MAITKAGDLCPGYEFEDYGDTIVVDGVIHREGCVVTYALTADNGSSVGIGFKVDGYAELTYYFIDRSVWKETFTAIANYDFDTIKEGWYLVRDCVGIETVKYRSKGYWKAGPTTIVPVEQDYDIVKRVLV